MSRPIARNEPQRVHFEQELTTIRSKFEHQQSEIQALSLQLFEGIKIWLQEPVDKLQARQVYLCQLQEEVGKIHRSVEGVFPEQQTVCDQLQRLIIQEQEIFSNVVFGVHEHTQFFKIIYATLSSLFTSIPSLNRTPLTTLSIN